MRKIKKIIMSLVLIGVMVIGMCGAVSAKTTTGVWNSPKTTAGSWWSGYDNDDITSLTGTSSSIYGGDVGVYFYASSVGMPNGFIRSSNRTGEIELKEDDSSWFDENETARKITGYFAYDNSGRYRMTSYKITYTNSSCIEPNKTVELYLRIKINTISGDTTKNVPEGLFGYQLWVN